VLLRACALRFPKHAMAKRRAHNVDGVGTRAAHANALRIAQRWTPNAERAEKESARERARYPSPRCFARSS